MSNATLPKIPSLLRYGMTKFQGHVVVDAHGNRAFITLKGPDFLLDSNSTWGEQSALEGKIGWMGDRMIMDETVGGVFDVTVNERA